MFDDFDRKASSEVALHRYSSDDCCTDNQKDEIEQDRGLYLGEQFYLIQQISPSTGQQGDVKQPKYHRSRSHGRQH